jgi:predicted alpha/beta-fold hydrolase
MVRCSAKLRARGIHVFRMNLRGCGAGLALARHPVHAGRSEDAAAALSFLAQCCPAAPVHLVGFSLGGNIALKFAGEAGPQPPKNLASVLAVAPPIDLAACSRHLRTGLGRFYDAVFLKGLFKHVKQRSAQCADAHVRPLSPRPRSVFEFDDLFTAPLSGFAGANDYYERASSKPLLSQINIPALMIAAASDPIVPVSSFENAAVSGSTQLVVTPCGGHLGYLGRTSSDPDRRWLDWRIVEWITAQRVAVPSPIGGEAQGRAMNAGLSGVVEWAGRVVDEGRADLILG